VEPGFAVREVLLDRDLRCPEVFSRSSGSRGYLLRRCASVVGLALIDVGSLWVAVVLAHRIFALEHAPLRVFQPLHLAIVAATMVGVFAVHRLYGVRASRHNRRRELQAACWVLAIALLLNGLASVWVPLDVFAAWLVAIGLLAVGRELYDFCLKVTFDLDFEARRTLVLGSPAACASFVDHHRRLPVGPKSTIIGMVGHSLPSAAWQRQTGIAALGVLTHIERIVKRTRPDELVIVDHELEVQHVGELAGLCRKHRLTLKLTDLEMRFGDSGVSLVPGLDEPLFVAAVSAGSGAGWLLKRSADLVVGSVLLVCFAPLMAVVALAVKLTSRGPVFYASERVGLGQRRFACYKFRTMQADAASQQAALEVRNEADGAIFKIKDDPRVTPLGRWLRALSIDELPQLINVLRGDMSLVGPRPLPLRDNDRLAGWHGQRHVVLPGMTGLWQVRGRSDASFADMIRLDLTYIESWSVWLDLAIIMRTVKTVLGSRGAY
jgi:exopolysaccharide biosynthesis polyprenyl glycosylphosphotransferase